ncbi:MAG: trypsin-like peptidase domain-containing protein [Planctomycetota bacterium]|nr:trypsin-like peptidase domain-containing protein [Planctomycetota bacterium]
MACVAFAAFAIGPVAAQELQQAEKAVMAAAKKVRPSVVTVITPKQGDFDLTGVVVASGGVILTLRTPLLKDGVLPKAVAVRFPGRGATVSAKVIDSGEKTDTVLLEAGGRYGKRISVGRSEDVSLGQWVLLVGNAFGAGRESTPTVSLGIVSGLHQDRTGLANVHVSALVNPGSHGAPVVDLSGRLVGITAGVVTADGGQSMVVPFDRVRAAYVARARKGPGAKLLPKHPPPARRQTRIGHAYGWVLARAAGKGQSALVGVRSRKRSQPAVPSSAPPLPDGPDLAPPGGSGGPGGPPGTRRRPVPKPVAGALEGIDRSSGVIVSADGMVICPLRVTGWPDAEHDLTVDLLDGRHLPARVVGTDERLRLALLKVDAQDLPVLEPAPPETVRRGTLCIALGFPHAAPEQATPLVTAGVISRTGALENLYPGFGALQTDAAVNGANRGGPLVDMRGRLLGVLLDVNDTEGFGYRFRARGRYTGNAGLGFAVPVPVLKRILPQLELGRTLRAAYLGVGTRSVKGGLLVMSVGKNNSQGEETAAHRAGLQEGDVLLSIDAEPLTSPRQLRRFLAGFAAGDTVRIALARAGERKTILVKLGSP